MNLINETVNHYASEVEIKNNLLMIDGSIYSIRNIDKIEMVKPIEKPITNYGSRKDVYVAKDSVESKTGIYSKSFTVPTIETVMIAVGFSFNIYYGEFWVPIYFKDIKNAENFRNELIDIKSNIDVG
jgi:hypothetical protein